MSSKNDTTHRTKLLQHLHTLTSAPSTEFRTNLSKDVTLQVLSSIPAGYTLQQELYEKLYDDDAKFAAQNLPNDMMRMDVTEADKRSIREEVAAGGCSSIYRSEFGWQCFQELEQRVTEIQKKCLANARDSDHGRRHHHQEDKEGNGNRRSDSVMMCPGVQEFSVNSNRVGNAGSNHIPHGNQSLPQQRYQQYNRFTPYDQQQNEKNALKNNSRPTDRMSNQSKFAPRNDFQTALEFNRNNGTDENGSNICNESGSSKTNHNNYRSVNNESTSRNSALSSDRSNIPQQSFGLSAGLKRKFQPPMRSNSIPCGSNGGTLSRPSSSHSNNGNNNSNNDDDELPEGLRGLDKELIEKIKNEIVDSGDPITFEDIAGLEGAKQTVMELVCWPMKRPDLFTGLRRGPNGLLLFGPPGTGKTLIGKAIAHESGATFFSISSSSLTSKWIGEGEKLVRTLFAVAAVSEPAVVFIDEIDSLLTARKADENEASRRIKTEFLVQLDGTGTSGQGRLLCIGATNRPHELDDAARRRFVKRLYIPLPETSDREILLRTLLRKNSHNLSSEDIQRLAKDTIGYSGADLKALCTDAALGPIRQLGPRALMVDIKDVPPISYRHFRQALKGMNPSVAQADLEIYLEWNNNYGSKSTFSYENDLSDDEC